MTPPHILKACKSFDHYLSLLNRLFPQRIDSFTKGALPDNANDEWIISIFEGIRRPLNKFGKVVDEGSLYLILVVLARALGTDGYIDE